MLYAALSRTDLSDLCGRANKEEGQMRQREDFVDGSCSVFFRTHDTFTKDRELSDWHNLFLTVCSRRQASSKGRRFGTYDLSYVKPQSYHMIMNYSQSLGSLANFRVPKLLSRTIQYR
jgi:hypothetical protein